MADLDLGPNGIYRREEGKWNEAIREYILDTTELIQRKGSQDHLRDYVDELGAALGGAVSYLYGTRKYRDDSLAEGFTLYPKGKCNSDEQIALARKHASVAYRLHATLKEIKDALITRINTCNAMMKNKDS